MDLFGKLKVWWSEFSANGRLLRRYRSQVQAIHAAALVLGQFSDDQLKQQTVKLRQRLAQGESLADLLPEAFATVQEVSARVLGMRHFDVQLIGGLALHEGKVAEMKTGEGKTLAATLPAYLNALTGQGVHMVTLNAYLAQRDMAWMAPIYEFLGIQVAVIHGAMSLSDRKKAYDADITYGTHTEFAFDYLRDHLVIEADHQVQRALSFAVIDEADSVLIDGARTPVIISGHAEQDARYYGLMTEVVRQLQVAEPVASHDSKGKAEDELNEPDGDVTLDHKEKVAHLTEQGQERLEALLKKSELLNNEDHLYDAQHVHLLFYVNAALRAYYFYQKDVDYMVQNQEVVIIDEHTGRAMPGRRWSEGLHQALEAKENVAIQQENVTLATITLQNYFRMYAKLAGMTGTAVTEAAELKDTYNLSVVAVPTHKPMHRRDLSDRVYMTVKEKYRALVEDVAERHAKGQPVLLGTASLESSEQLSQLLKKRGIDHHVLNAKHHDREAQVIAQAGCWGAVTVVTNMAGRGTDIVLGGHPDFVAERAQAEVVDNQAWQSEHDRVVAAGGLCVLSSERHESRRIDDQLRGRSGRQGDPGESRCYLSLEDELMRVFAPPGMMNVLKKLGMQENETLEAPMLTRAIQNAQRKVEGHYYDIRKQILKFDNIINDQRNMLYSQRDQVLQINSMAEARQPFCHAALSAVVDQHVNDEWSQSDWDIDGLHAVLMQEFNLDFPVESFLLTEKRSPAALVDALAKAWLTNFDERNLEVPAEARQKAEKTIFLQLIDQHWRDHLSALDHLRRGIHLRGYAQKDPAQEYQREAYHLFTGMLDQIKQQYICVLSRLRIQVREPSPAMVNIKGGHLGKGVLTGSAGWGQKTTVS